MNEDCQQVRENDAIEGYEQMDEEETLEELEEGSEGEIGLLVESLLQGRGVYHAASRPRLPSELLRALPLGAILKAGKDAGGPHPRAPGGPLSPPTLCAPNRRTPGRPRQPLLTGNKLGPTWAKALLRCPLSMWPFLTQGEIRVPPPVIKVTACRRDTTNGPFRPARRPVPPSRGLRLPAIPTGTSTMAHLDPRHCVHLHRGIASVEPPPRHCLLRLREGFEWSHQKSRPDGHVG
ncbi:hypothetical protein NDU88_002927 [Pleurodeles waltl]|uniref:Uncharacterized protein n=1 Tax=Pleurodeles waltl TaxID=8319 RepID=A0AAV7Q7I6_PLEWA|nr:hypothetical protein NDU88_002927 [Pleurodeles waltl]